MIGSMVRGCVGAIAVTATAAALAQPAPPDAASLCRALDPAALARIGIRAPAGKPIAVGPVKVSMPGLDAPGIDVRQTNCRLQSSELEPPRVTLAVFQAADAKSLKALVAELHGGDPSDPKPAEWVEFANGWCMVDRNPVQEPGRPPVAPHSWDQSCSVVRGQRIVQLGHSDKDRSRLAKLADFRTLFESIASRF